jgi:hypothetical protein
MRRTESTIGDREISMRGQAPEFGDGRDKLEDLAALNDMIVNEIS